MKNIELLEAFELEINKLDDNLTKPATRDSEYWLNQGLDKFWKTRYSGVNYKAQAFEQTQKRIDDLRTLVETKVYNSQDITADSNCYKVELPENYVILLGDTAGITPNGINECWEKDDNGYKVKYTDTLEATIETLDRQLANSLSEHKLKYCQARPLKLVQNNEILLFTDDNYKVSYYRLVYLRRPIKIDIHTEPFSNYTDMPEHTHSEIVKLAAKMYIENQKDPRYNTLSNEVNEME